MRLWPQNRLIIHFEHCPPRELIVAGLTHHILGAYLPSSADVVAVFGEKMRFIH
jgi:hypothetical protein